jgi:hypothetical protein
MLVKTLVKDKDKVKVRDRVKAKVRVLIKVKIEAKARIKAKDKGKMHLLDLWQIGSILPIKLKVNSKTVKRLVIPLSASPDISKLLSLPWVT